MILYKKFIFENEDVIKRPIFKINEFDELYENIIKDIDEKLTIPKDVLNSFKIKNQLNQDVWDDETIKPEIRKKLIHIVENFINDIFLPKNVTIKDIIFVGSLANYNWSKYSDFDIHIILDFSKFKEDEEFIKQFFDTQKNNWNDKHNIKIKNYPVELYVQDEKEKEKLNSSAIYSLLDDKWLSKPEKTNFKLDKSSLKKKVEKFFSKIKVIEKLYDEKKYKETIKKIEKIKDYIKTMRKSGLESGGEFSTENIIFKILRRTNFMELINNYKNKAYDELMSLNEDLP
jgi:hypothetical protein